jgi:integrase
MHDVQGIGYAWAESMVGGMKETQLVPNIIRHHVGALARCLDWAVRRGTIDSNPLRLLPNGYLIYKDGSREDQCRDRRLESHEEQCIRNVLDGGNKPSSKQRELSLEDRDAYQLMFDLAIETAMRMREIYTVDVSQVDIARRTIFLLKTKNGDKRQVPMSSVAVAAVNTIGKNARRCRRVACCCRFSMGTSYGRRVVYPANGS